MRRLIVAALAATALAVPVPAAQADGDNYKGGCGAQLMPLPTSGLPLWYGVFYAYVASTNPPGGSISIDCVLYINGVYQRVVASGATHPGATVAVAADGVEAADSDVIDLCDEVTINDVVQPLDCDTFTTTPLVPPVLVEVADAVFAQADAVIAEADAVVPAVCSALAYLAPRLGPVVTDPNNGDVWVGGTRVWDCP